MSSPDSLSSNPLLQSTFSIKPDPSIAFTVVYAVFFVVMLVRVTRHCGRRFAYVLMTLVAAIRTVTFAIRYKVSKTSPLDSDFEGVTIAAGVLIIAGYYLVLEAVLDLLVDWVLVIRQTELSASQRSLSYTVRHMVLVGISVIGIVGSVLLAKAIPGPISASQYNTDNNLRIASGALFVVFAALMLAIAVGSSFMALGKRHITTPGLTSALLLILSVMCLLESIYRLVSSTTHKGWIVREQAVDVLVFMPELIALIIFAVIDFNYLEDVRVWRWNQRREESPSARQQGTGEPHQTRVKY